VEFSDVARTTFSCRSFTDEAVPDEAIARILDVARFAPSGGNRQGWHVTVVRDPEAKRLLGQLGKPAWNVYVAQMRAGEKPWNTVEPSSVDPEVAAGIDAPNPLLDRMDAVPVVLVVSVDLSVVASMDRDLDRVGVISGASVYPFVWGLLMAARDQGYAGALTTFVAARESEAKALLGIPDHHAVAAMVPLGRPVKVLTKLTRKPVSAFATVDRFDGPALVAPTDEPR
jgi:nitroreductase